MRRTGACLLLLVAAVLAVAAPALADGKNKNRTTAIADTVGDVVRVTILRMGGVDRVLSVEGGGGGDGGCAWSVAPAEVLGRGDYLVVPTGPGPEDRQMLYGLLCDGSLRGFVWISPEDVVDLDALARAEAERYVEEVLVPEVSIGVNPAARGLVGLPSWFWIEGFGGSVTAPPISAFGVSIEVRMSSGGVTWDFGDGTVEPGDLGRAYPKESTVRHVYQSDGSYRIAATIELVPEYRVDGGGWLELPPLSTSASTTHDVEQRQAVITNR